MTTVNDSMETTGQEALSERWLMLWTKINLRDNTKETVKLSMYDVRYLRKAPSSSWTVYEIQNYPFLKVENHPLRWIEEV